MSGCCARLDPISHPPQLVILGLLRVIGDAQRSLTLAFGKSGLNRSRRATARVGTDPGTCVILILCRFDLSQQLAATIYRRS